MFVNKDNQTISVTRTNSSESFKAGSHFQIRMSPRNPTEKRKIHIFLLKSYISSEKRRVFLYHSEITLFPRRKQKPLLAKCLKNKSNNIREIG
jgi:hypothetical protein